MAEKLLRLQEVPLTYRDTRTSVEVRVHAGTEKICANQSAPGARATRFGCRRWKITGLEFGVSG